MKKMLEFEEQENPNGNKIFEEWEIRFTNTGIQKLEMKRGNVKINEDTALRLNWGRKEPAVSGTYGITVVYYKKGEDKPFGGDDVLSGVDAARVMDKRAV